MVTKPLKEFTQPTGRRKFKGNMDVEIAVDMMEMAPHIDHAILISGDGDFRRLIEALQRQGVRVSVVSTIRTQPPMVADELRRQADIFVDLAGLQNLIARETQARQDLPLDEDDDYDDEDDYEDDDEDELEDTRR